MFSEFGENTYLLYAPGGEAFVFDLGCNSSAEWRTIDDFVKKAKCKPILLLNTHGHLDHLFGANRGRAGWGVPLAMHEDDIPLLQNATAQANLYGMEMEPVALPEQSLEDGQVLAIHGHEMEVVHTPGHSPGGVCFYLREAGILFSGDTLFQGSIGRTDFRGGDYDTLIESIRTRLLTLPDETIVLPGHGPQTTIGAERTGNPFLR